jgi:hypothetical protein
MVATRSLAAIAALALAGCSHSGESSSTPIAVSAPPSAAAAATPAEEKTKGAAQKAAQAEFDAYAAGDWRGAWDLWTTEAQQALSRDDYDSFHATCKTVSGLTFEITNVRLEGDKATVAWKRSIAAGTSEVRYEAGRWRYQPAVEDLTGYRKGLKVMIATAKKEGRCG